MRLRNLKNKDELILNCDFLINNPQDFKGKWHEVFKNNNPIHIEIGMGKGTFIKEMALAFPNINFIGIEKFDGVVARAINNINDNIPSNLRIIKTDAINVKDIFEKEIDTIYLNFSDPWPKPRHEKRRLTSSNFLNLFESVFKNNKEIMMKTDNRHLFEYSLISFNNNDYKIKEISLDLHSDDCNDNIETEYERKFSLNNNVIYYVKVEKK